MPYETMAPNRTPALAIYLRDGSGSMSQTLAALPGIGLVTIGDQADDLLDEGKTVDQISQIGAPEPSRIRATETAKSIPGSYRCGNAKMSAMDRRITPLPLQLVAMALADVGGGLLLRPR